MTHDGVVTRVEFSYDMTEASSNRIFRLLRFRLLCWLGRGLFYFSGFSTHSTRRRLFSGTTIASLVLTFSFLAVCPQLACPRRCLVGPSSNPAEGIRPEEEARSAPSQRFQQTKRRRRKRKCSALPSAFGCVLLRSVCTSTLRRFLWPTRPYKKIPRLAFLPLPANTCSLVWSDPTQHSQPPIPLHTD